VPSGLIALMDLDLRLFILCQLVIAGYLDPLRVFAFPPFLEQAPQIFSTSLFSQ
jgi:hypothetical protein